MSTMSMKLEYRKTLEFVAVKANKLAPNWASLSFVEKIGLKKFGDSSWGF